MSAFRGDRLLQARLDTGLTRSELAKRVGAPSRDRVRQWELGLERPQPRMVPLLAAAVGIKALWLLDGDPRNPTLMELRIAAGMSLDRICAESNLPYGTYYRLERGRRAGPPADEIVTAIADALRLTWPATARAIESSRRRG
jgi:transcriptional regulator with XRE-family HTH domain